MDPEKINSVPNDFRFHLPLDRDSKQIRLLTIEAGDHESDICCTINTVSLTTNPPPKYEALSYCWGDMTDTRIITLCHPDFQEDIRQPFTVTANLASALHCIRLEDRKRTVWIDAICINQSDVLERGHQVSFMRSVYKSAERTLIWLGDDDGTVGMAWELVAAIVRKMMHFDQPNQLELNAEYTNSVAHEISDHLTDLRNPGNLVSQSEDLPPLESTHWSALARFLARPWFRRVWVIQEAAVSDSATVYCGDNEIEFVAIGFAASWISRNNLLMQTGHEGFRWADNVTFMFRFANPVAMAVLSPNPLPLLWLIRDYDATDPRDKVFASLPLMFNEDVGQLLPEILIPDYTKSTEAVYRDLARYAIRADRNLDSLCMVQPHRASAKLPYDFPEAYHLYASLPAPDAFVSWVPRWEYGFGIGNSGPLGIFPDAVEGSRPLYRASNTLPMSALTLKDPTEPNSLLVRGLKLDRVTSIGDCIWPNFIDIDFPPHPIRGSIARTDRNSLRQTWNTYEQELLSYPSREDPMTVLRLLLVANRTRMKQRADEDPTSEADFAAYLQTIRWDIETMPTEYRKRHTDLCAKGDARRYSRDLAHSCAARSVFGTSLGYLGLCHFDVHVGDVVCMLFGGKVLYILRQNDRTLRSSQTWRMLGEAYMHGVMDGTALSMKRAFKEPAEIFDLR